MGEALSVPEGQDGQAQAQEVGSAQESVLLSQLIQLLHQREGHSLLLSDLGALLPGTLRQRVKDQGGLRSWLQRYSSLFAVVGQPGKESVTLCLGAAMQHLESNTVPSDNAALAHQDNDDSPTAGDPNGEDLEEDIDSQSAVQLRGLPYRATVEDIVTFLGEHGSDLAESNAVQLVQNRDGRPSGFARVQFVSPESAKKCVGDLHLRSMEDRYVEVFLYSERPSKGRQRRGGHEDGAAPASGDPAKMVAAIDTLGVTREQVVRECRMQMADPKNRRLLLSMLGVALSPGARSYLKQMDQGLKHFLTQFPTEFSVDGGKGCEYVSYTPTQLSLSQAIDGFDGSAAARGQDDLGPLVPASPKPMAHGHHVAASPSTGGGPASATRGMPNTPSDWGTPGLQYGMPAPWALPPWPQTAPGAAAVADPTAAWQMGGMGGLPQWPMAANGGQFGWPGAWAGGYGSAIPPWGPDMQNPSLSSSGDSFASAEAAAAAAAAASVFGMGAAGATAAVPMAAPEAPAPAHSSGPTVTAVRLRGLPFTSVEQDVLAFFAQHDIVDRIADGPKAVNILVRSNGRPSGQAIVQMREPHDAELAHGVLHGQWMGSRYIEVFLLTQEENEAQANGGGTGKGESGAKASQPEQINLSMGVPAAPVQAPPSTAPTLPNSIGAGQPDMSGGFAGMPPMPPPWQLNMWSAAMAGSLGQGGPPPMGPGLGGGMPGADGTDSWEALFQFLGPESAAALANGVPPPPLDFSAMGMPPSFDVTGAGYAPGPAASVPAASGAQAAV